MGGRPRRAHLERKGQRGLGSGGDSRLGPRHYQAQARQGPKGQARGQGQRKGRRKEGRNDGERGLNKQRATNRNHYPYNTPILTTTTTTVYYKPPSNFKK